MPSCARLETAQGSSASVRERVSNLLQVNNLPHEAELKLRAG
jgi:hypothetical protein